MRLKRIITRAILFIVLAVIALVFGAWILMHTRPVERLLLAEATKKTGSAIGSKVRFGSMSIGWTHLSVDLRDITIFGKGAPTRPPFFTAQHAAAEVYLWPLFKKQFRFAFITLDRPTVNFLVDKDGSSNLPQPAKTNSKTGIIRTLLNLQVRDFVISSGEISVSDRKIPLSADLHDLHSQIKFDEQRNAYSGSLDYRAGLISAANADEFQHALRASFTLGESYFDLRSLNIAFGASNVSAAAHLADFSAPRLNGSYKADLFAGDFARALRKSVPVRGELVVSGELNYRHLAGVPFLDAMTASGEFQSRALAVQYRQFAPEVRLLHAAYSLNHGNLHVSNLAARTLGGTLTGKLEAANLGRHAVWQANLALRGLSLATLNQLARTEVPGAQKLQLLGIANISVAARASSLQNLEARALVDIRNPSERLPHGSQIPLSGLIDVAYNSRLDAANFHRSFLQVGSTRLTLAGSLGRRAQLHILLAARDLHQLSALTVAVAHDFRSTGPKPEHSAPSRIDTLYGSAQFTGTVSGRVRNPSVQGTLAAQNLQVSGASWRSVLANISFSPSRASIQNARLENSQNSLDFSANIGLQHWSLTPTSKIQLEAAIHSFSLAQIEHVAGKEYPVSGALNANLTVSGTERNLNGRGTFKLANASLWNESFRSLSGDIHLAGESLAVSAQAQTAAGNISAKLAYSLDSKVYNATLTVPALDLSQIQIAKLQQLGISGTLKASANAHGNLQQPVATASLQIANLQIRGQSISQLQAQLDLQGRQANFSLTAIEAQSQAHLAGEITLLGQYPIHAVLDVPPLSLAPVLASYFPSARQLQGQTAIHAAIDGPLKNTSALRVHLNIPRLTMSYQSVHLALVRPLNIDYANGLFAVDPTELKGTGTDLKIQGRIPVKGGGASASLMLDGAIDLAALQSFSPTIQSSGKIEIHLAERGGARNFASNLQGRVQIEKASLFTSSSPVGIENLDATFQLANRRITISHFNGQVGGGTLNAQGSVDFGEVTSFNVSFQGNRLRIRYPQGIRSVLTANLQFSGTTQASLLSGRVLLDELSFTQQFDMATVMSGFVGNSGAAAPSHFMQNLKLNVSLQSARELQLASSQISMAGSANLNIVGTAADPVILGRLALTGGEVFFMGKRYQVQSGTVSFANPVRTEPVVDVYVQTTVNQYNITLNFVGPIERLRTNYTSVPPLSPADIINELAFGKTTEEAAAAGSTPASVGATSVIAQGVGSQIAGKLQNLTGVSQLTISPNTGSNESGPGAQIAVQEQVTGNLLLTFSTDVTATQNTAVQVQYSATQHLTVSVLRDQNGGYALDIRIRKSF